jgi:hypothetical protein
MLHVLVHAVSTLTGGSEKAEAKHFASTRQGLA